MHLSSIPKVQEHVIWNTEKKQSEVLRAFFAFVFSKLQPALNLPKPTCTQEHHPLSFFFLSFFGALVLRVHLTPRFHFNFLHWEILAQYLTSKTKMSDCKKF